MTLARLLLQKDSTPFLLPEGTDTMVLHSAFVLPVCAICLVGTLGLQRQLDLPNGGMTILEMAAGMLLALKSLAKEMVYLGTVLGWAAGGQWCRSSHGELEEVRALLAWHCCCWDQKEPHLWFNSTFCKLFEAL